MRAPDVAFVPADWLAGIDPKHALKAVPTLAVEVLGSAEPPALSRKIAQNPGARLAGTSRDMARRIHQYFDAGVLRVLVIDPEERETDVYAPNEPLTSLSATDTLVVPDVLPGFSVRVRELFG